MGVTEMGFAEHFGHSLLNDVHRLPRVLASCNWIRTHDHLKSATKVSLPIRYTTSFKLFMQLKMGKNTHICYCFLWLSRAYWPFPPLLHLLACWFSLLSSLDGCYIYVPDMKNRHFSLSYCTYF